MFSVVLLLLVLLYYAEADIQISGSVMIAKRVKSLKCSSDVNLSRYPGRMVAYHQWNQVYPGENDRFISILRAVKALNTQYTFELQKFDNNTNIYSSFSVYNASNGFQHVFNLTINCSGVQTKWISLVDDDYYRYQVDHIITYNGSDSVKFSCLQYLHLSASLLDMQIGWINTAGDRIFTYNQTEIMMNLAEIHNGSMLCCLYYTTSSYNNGKLIERFVKDKTLLIYQKETPVSGDQPNGTTTESYWGSEINRNISQTSITTQFITNTTNETGKNRGTTNEMRKNTGTPNETDHKSNTTNATDKNTGTTNGADSGEQDADTTNYVIIIISSISATMLLLLVGICAVKKRCWNKTNRPERAQIPLPQIPGARFRPANEPDSNTPFYLNLLFKRECELEIQAQEEPQYEEVMYQ